MEEDEPEKMQEELVRETPVDEPQVKERGTILSELLLKRGDYGKGCNGVRRLNRCYPLSFTQG